MKNPLFFFAMITKDLVRKLAQERIDELDRGLFIVDISISKKSVIELEIDKVEGYVAIEDCVSVSRNVEHNLDREEQDFSLEVASAGVSSPLKLVRQYKKNIGRTIKVKTISLEEIEAKLTMADDEKITLEWQAREPKKIGKGKETVDKKLELSYENIKEAIVIISF